MAIKGVLPKTIWVIDVPVRPDDLAKRWHNKYAKAALRDTLEWWHKHPDGFKDHFERGNREKFQHFPRTEKYKRAKAKGVKVDGKRYFSTVDLVKTSRTKEHMRKNKKITVGGTAVGDTLRGTLILRFPFKGGTGRLRQLHRVPKNLIELIKQDKLREKVLHQALTIQKMRIELERFDEDDPRLLAEHFLRAYMQKVEAHRAGRKRTRISRGNSQAA
jgi:hypothetical protein